MGIEEIPIDMGRETGFWFVVIVGTDVYVLKNEAKLAYFYRNLRGTSGTAVQKHTAIKGIPNFLEFAKNHSVLKTVTNWSIFGIIQ